ncbi:MAG: two-component regulator propeller domain-containing protein [bacterium]
MGKTATIALSWAIFASSLWAQPFQWETFTSTSDVRDIESVNGSLWAVTSGGLVQFAPASGLFEVYTNTRGLSSNRAVAVGADRWGGIWVGLEDRRLNRLDTETGRVEVLPDLQGEVFSITDIICWEDFVYVASDVGAYRFAYYETVGGFRVQESYSKLGQLSPRTEVRRLAVADGYLWAATPYGLARASLDQATLVPPSAWENITVANGLPSNDVRAITAAPEGGIWIGTALGAVRWFDGNFVGRSDFGALRDFAVVNDTAYAVTSLRVYQFDGASGWRVIGNPIPFSIRRLAAASNGESEQILWGAVQDAGDKSGGISAFIGGEWMQPLRAEGPNGNDISALAMDAAGKLWVGTKGTRGGASVYADGQWTNYGRSSQFSAPFFGAEVRAFAFDDFGATWVSTHGQGIGWFRGDSIRIFNSHDSTGSRVTGISGAPAFCLVNAIVKDVGGNLWLTNRLSTRNAPLLRIAREWIAAGGPDDPWMDYVNANPRGPTEVEQLFIDGFDRKWLGGSPDGSGTHILDDRGTPLDTVGDRWSFFVPDEKTDPTFCFDDVDRYSKCWAVDAQGYLWIGTINGVYYTPMGIPQDVAQLQFMCLYPRPLGTQVFAIHVDAEDNKWFGTDGGVSVMDRDFNWIHYFRTADDVLYPSGIISNYVTAITSNPATGEVWIGTPDGLSRLKTPYQQTGGELGEIEPYPNPFRVGQQRMYVQDMGVFDELRIFTLSGRRVRTLSWRDMITPGIGWDGRNSEGKLVSSGVYILVCYTHDGKTARGKVAVLAE